MIFSVALKNLFSDRLKFIATIVGIAFSVMLMAGQSAIFLGACRDITMMIDRSRAALWIMPTGSLSFEEALPLLTEFERQSALVTPGIKRVTSVVFSFFELATALRRKEHYCPGKLGAWLGGASAFRLSSDWTGGGTSVIVDRSYLDFLGASGIGAIAGIDDYRVHISALSEGIRSFTHSPYVFVKPSQERKYLDLPVGATTFLLMISTIRPTLKTCALSSSSGCPMWTF